MNLLFKKLTLENFRIYYGKHSIEFSIDEAKHLTVVHAENSTGKTTMLNSIKWCLYGETPDFTDNRILVNDRSGKSTCSVRLNFVYDGEEYSAYRNYDQQTNQARFTLDKISTHGASSPVDEPESAIDNILPKDLSNYFLFAGEHFTGALGTGDRVSHRRAIRDILGFILPETAISDLEHLIKKNERALNALSKKEAGSRVVAEEVERLDNELTVLEKSIEKTKVDIQKYKIIKKDAQAQIDKSNHLKAKQLNKDRKDKEYQLNIEKDREVSLLTQKQSLVSKYGLVLFGKELTDTSLDFIKTEKRRIPAPYDQRFVNELLSDHECICGRELCEGSKEYDAVKSMVSSASTEIIDQRAQKAISIGDSFDQRSEDFLQEVDRIEKELQKTIKRISGLENSIVQIDNDIQSIGDVDISEYQNMVKKAESKLLNLSESLGADERSKSIKKERLKTKRLELARVRPNSGKHQQFDNFIKVANQVRLRIEDKLEKTEKTAILIIAEQVQKNIKDSLRKPFKVRVSEEDYSFVLVDPETDRVIQGSDGGKGQALLSNLSFVTALIAYSKSRAESKSELFPPGTIAPFVIDAPFGQMDSTYQRNTLKFLPAQSHQLILFLSTGQWDDKFEDIIGKYIGRRYLLVNHGEMQSADLESITIKGNTYNLSEPGDSRSQTTIREI